MNIEELWKRCNFNDTKLKNYGFHKEKDNYIYQTNIMKNTFEVTIIIPKDQKFSIKVVDLNTNYEYTYIVSKAKPENLFPRFEKN